MKLLIAILLSLTTLISCKHTEETNIGIKGEVKNLEGIHVSLIQNGKLVGKMDVKDNQFHLQGKLIKNQLCELLFKSDIRLENGQRRGWLHPISIFVEEDATYLLRANDKNDILHNNYDLITTSKIQQQFQAYRAEVKQSYTLQKKHLAELEIKRTQALHKKRNKEYGDYTDSIRLNEQAMLETSNRISRKFISRNPNNYVSLYLLSVAPNILKSLGFYQSIYQQLQGNYLDHPYAIRFAKQLKSVEKMTSGKLNIQFEAVNIKGE